MHLPALLEGRRRETMMGVKSAFENRLRQGKFPPPEFS